MVGDLPMGQVMAEEAHVREQESEEDCRREDNGWVIEHNHDCDVARE